MFVILLLIALTGAFTGALDLEGVELDKTPALTLEEAAAHSENVFVGRVIRLDGEDIAVFKVDKVFKGSVPDEVKVNRNYEAYNIEGWLENLTYPFFVGKRYVVFAKNSGECFEPYYTNNIQWTVARVEEDDVCTEKFRDHGDIWLSLSKFGKEVKKAK